MRIKGEMKRFMECELITVSLETSFTVDDIGNWLGNKDGLDIASGKLIF